jgi:glycosyltransferase involved in cell wall biosynthesis
LRNWPDKRDQFIIFHNSGNQGVKRILASLSKLDQVTMVPFADSSSFLPASWSKVVRYFTLPLRFLLMKWRAQRLLARQGSFDALFANNGGYPGAWGTLAALWAGSSLGLRTRLLLVHHEATGRGPLRHSFESLLDLGVQHWATDLVTVSRATRSTLIERRSFYNYLNPIRVIHNGVDMSTDTDTLTVDLRAQLAIPADSFVVGMVGRLERYKGHEDLILALGELPSNTFSQVVVVFVGGGSLAETERLQSVAQKIGAASQVRFAGYIEGSIGALMCQFDLLAMLTKDFEGFGLTIAEAMWAGTPVLATMVGAVPEFVTEDVAILIQPEAPDEIADALLRVISNGEEAQQRATRARQHISKYNGQAMAKKFHRLLLVSGE